MKHIIEYIQKKHITIDIPDVDLNNLSVIVEPNKPINIRDYLQIMYMMPSKNYHYLYLSIHDLLNSTICKENSCKCFLDAFNEIYTKEKEKPVEIKCRQAGLDIGSYYYTDNSWKMNGEFVGNSNRNNEQTLKLINQLNTSWKQ